MTTKIDESRVTQIDLYVFLNSEAAALATDTTVWVLTQDVTNPKPDRRTKYDWRLHPAWKAGTRFTLRLQKDYMASITAGRWSDTLTPFDTRWKALAPSLQRANASIQEQIDQDNIPEIDLIEKLIDLKLVTVEQVEDAIRLVREDLNEKYDREEKGE